MNGHMLAVFSGNSGIWWPNCIFHGHKMTVWQRGQGDIHFTYSKSGGVLVRVTYSTTDTASVITYAYRGSEISILPPAEEKMSTGRGELSKLPQHSGASSHVVKAERGRRQ
jgi:hypothetical protein